MKRILFLFITISFISTKLLAQNGKVVLCEDYNKTTGAPTNISKSWNVTKNTGSNVYIIYQQDYNIKDKLLLFVDKKNSNGTYISYDTQDFNNDPKADKKNWLMYDYKFKEDGDYRITVTKNGDDALAVTYTNIGYIKDSDSKSKDTDDFYDTDYYEDSKIEFGTTISGTKLTNKGNSFRLTNGKCDIVGLLTMDKALKIKSFDVTIYYGDDYKEKISQQTYNNASLDWDWIKIPISTLTKAGKYVVDVYTEDDVYVNSGYFEITR